ncbi:hypothetical protein FZEAL_10272 [Fusarium zealandicum]|uniref:FAD-binding domain-containing protein n=1 Tax=Fusarium zealandicum TaxID=1053134 RepID=A0A8H4U3M9_9HYPO|nr:hypothetical protein FZEAL_10272 [Fusarium zealandicum]
MVIPRSEATNGLAVESRGLRVVIIGAGIGELTASIFLGKQGHHVTLLEQSRFANEVGAAMHLAPNASGLLRRIGILAETIDANAFERITEFNANNKVVRDVDITELNKMWQHPWHLVHRLRLHQELKRTATSSAGPDTPAELRTSSRVVDVDTSAATVLPEDGSQVQGDLVIGADGVHFKTRQKVVEREVKPHSSGKSAFRLLVPRQAP